MNEQNFKPRSDIMGVEPHDTKKDNVQDIFSGTEPVHNAPETGPGSQANTPRGPVPYIQTDSPRPPGIGSSNKSPMKLDESGSGGKKKKATLYTIIIVGFIIIIAVIVGLAINVTKKASQREGKKDITTTDDGAIKQVDEEKNQIDFRTPFNGLPEETFDQDSDRDGLTDKEEKKLGTDPFFPDSDYDNLSDLDEVKLFLTDPLDNDTDSDGFLDGDEVRDGFNPNGSGKLFNFEETIREQLK